MILFNQGDKPRVAARHEADKYLVIAVFAVLVFGLVTLSSASGAVAYVKFDNPYHYVKHQLLGLCFGIAAFLFLARTDYHLWRKYAFHFLIFSIVLLLLVFIPGLSAHYGKARSWINVFGFSLQPSEFVKLSFLFYLAAWLETRKGELSDVARGIGPFLVILGIITALMIAQPDIGTLFIIAAISFIVYFVGGGGIRHILLIILFAGLGFALMVQLRPYQADRFRCLFDPGSDARGACYQTNQSLIAVGSGGIFGRGLGESRQKYMYLPEIQGDSIFAVIAEETGLIFSGFLTFCYLFIFYRGYRIATRAPDIFGRLLAIGIVSWIAIQAAVNIGGMVNIMPMTGVPLPLVSYGGSSILATLAALGVL